MTTVVDERQPLALLQSLRERGVFHPEAKNGFSKSSSKVILTWLPSLWPATPKGILNVEQQRLVACKARCQLTRVLFSAWCDLGLAYNRRCDMRAVLALAAPLDSSAASTESCRKDCPNFALVHENKKHNTACAARVPVLHVLLLATCRSVRVLAWHSMTAA